MILLPIDVIKLIGLRNQSTQSYLNLALCCRRFSKLLQKPRRCTFLRHFTEIEHKNDGWGKRKEWWINGKRHREDGPAREWSDGGTEWYLNGKRHREDGPAIEYANGYKSWYLNGKLHREDGPATEYAGYKAWYLNGKRHREDGPAIEYANGTKKWYQNGKFHRGRWSRRRMVPMIP